MGKNKKDRAYAIDCAVIYYGQEKRLGKRKIKSRWKYFDTLPKAVRFAREHGLPAGDILDQEGNVLPPIDLDEPIYYTHHQLRMRLEATERAAAYAAEAKALADKDAEEHEARMLQAGYIPLETFRRMVDHQVTGNGREGYTEYNITLRVRDTDDRAANIFNALVNGRP